MGPWSSLLTLLLHFILLAESVRVVFVALLCLHVTQVDMKPAPIPPASQNKTFDWRLVLDGLNNVEKVTKIAQNSAKSTRDNLVSELNLQNTNFLQCYSY